MPTPGNAFARAVATPAFQRGTLGLVFASAVLVGVETDRALVEAHRAVFAALDLAVVALFVAELAVRIAACGRRPLDFLRSPWNVFDLAVVALSLLPAVGPLATVARLARVLRVLRLVSMAPQLRLIVETMLRSIPSLGHVALLLGLLLYVYAVIGVKLFGQADPGAWGSLGRGLLTLFTMLTLEGWAEVQARSLAVYPWAWLYYASFILVAVFVVVNLFVAVVLNNLEEAREEARREEAAAAGGGDEAVDFEALRRQLDALERRLRAGERARRTG